MTEAPTFLPPFNEQIAVSLRDALQDRILLDVQQWFIEGTIDQFNAFSDAMAGEVVFEEGRNHKVFNRVGGNGLIFPRWDIAGGKHKKGFRTPNGRPLFAGRIKAKVEWADRAVQQGARRGRWALKAELALNPTRWVRSQSNAILRPEANPSEVPVRMFAREGHLNFKDEIPLLQGSNVLIGRRVRYMARPALWRVQLQRYYEGVLGTLDAAFARSATLSGINLSRTTPRLTIKEIETYWEFATHQPIEDMRSIEEPFRALSARSFVRWYSVDKRAGAKLPKIQVGQEDNAPVLRVKLVAGTEVRIYAKTTKRIRFEVLRKSKLTRVPFTADNHDALYDWVIVAAAEATERLNDLLENWRRSGIRSQQYSLSHLINSFYGAMATPAAQHMLDMLARHGSLARVQGSDLAVEIDRLRAAGVLEHAGHTGQDHLYQVTARYRSALAALRAPLPPPPAD